MGGGDERQSGSFLPELRVEAVEPVHDGLELGGDAGVVDRGDIDQDIALQDLLLDLRHIVGPYADPVAVAVPASDAGMDVELRAGYLFDMVSGFFRPFSERIGEDGCRSFGAGAAQQHEDLHHGLIRGLCS